MLQEIKDTLPVIIAGHVDHGKSTLIGRLLHDAGGLKEEKYRESLAASSRLRTEAAFAFVPDSLMEEREGGLTIDTTQACLDTGNRKYVLIDAPGHKEFLRNMLTGASYAEAAVLIIDVGEGIMEQTRRHACLLSMVGIKDVVVLINKMDLVGYSKEAYDRVVPKAREFLAALALEPRFFIPASALSGANVAMRGRVPGWYDGPCLLEAINTLDLQAPGEKPFRFPVQDVYEIDSVPVLAGRIESGEALRGMDVLLLPEGRRCHVREIRKYQASDITKASRGESIGLILEESHCIRRGDILSGADGPRVTRVLEANLFWFHGAYDINETLTIRFATQETACTVEIREKFDPATMTKKMQSPDYLDLGEVARVIIRTGTRVVVDPFSFIPEMGRFVVEKNGIPVGGGTVT